MLQSAQPRPATFRKLLGRVAQHALDELDAYPWYRALDFDLPVQADPAAIATQANAVRRDARSRGIRLAGVICQPLLEGHYNRLVSSTRNKAVVLLGLTLRIIQVVMSRAADRPVRILIDRHGGRIRYAQHLMTSFDGYELQILEESDRRSSYRLTRSPAACRLEFCTQGEDRHLPIALASICSKYLRELFMRGFNCYWQDRVPSLRPTAGYYADARRFLDDIAPAIERESTDRSLLVRRR
jgi:hypothetical protein